MAEDIGIELHDKIKAAFDARCGKDSTLTHIKRKIENGTATMEDTSVYARRLGELLRKSIESTTKPDYLPDGKMYYNIAQSILEPLLRNNYDDVNAICEEVQSALDAKMGIGLKPQKADFPAERVRAAIGGAAVKETAEHAIQVLGRTAENITGSFQTDYVKKNAEFRSKAGLSCYIERKDGHNCCDWCAGLAGRYRYPDEVPKDVYRRHDNCTCDVSYVSEKGRQNVHSKQWTNEQAKAQRIEYAASVPKPMKLTKAEAQALESQIAEKEKSKKRGLPTSINKEYILSPEYKAKFRGISKNTKTDELICQKARDMLIHRNNTYYEDMYLFDEIKGSVVATQTHSNKPQEIVYNLSLETAIKKHRPNFLISLHNHPESKPPSGDDLASCGMRKYQKGLICCHNGDVYIYQTGKKPFTANLFDATVDKYKKRGYTEISAYEQTLNQFQEDYGIRWEKR